MLSIGQDITDHLHESGGPLHYSCSEAECDECHQEIAPYRYHTVCNRILCDRHVLNRVVLELEPLVIQSSSPATQEAFDVLRQFAAEFAAGEWVKR
jgi:hypothetical protein